ncbi:hypothetical protein [Nocardia sp. SSK8]|uniref:hypothetical protein n=1 Tax=Nocardia sp. SSK8 TaxID=3120154 RepID=UPI0030091A1D
MIAPRRGPGLARASPARIGPARVIRQERVGAQMTAALRARADTRARVDVQVSVVDGGSAAIPAGAEVYAAGRSGMFGVTGFRADEREAR